MLGVLALAPFAVSGSAYIPLTVSRGDSEGVVNKWNLSRQGGSIPYLINPTRPEDAAAIQPAGTTADDLVRVVRAAFLTWQDVPTSRIRFSYEGTTTLTNEADGNNVVTFSPTDFSGPDEASASARMRYALEDGPVNLPNGAVLEATTGEIFDVDIVVNPTTEFSLDRSLEGKDIWRTVTHEVGHFIGLGHNAIIGSIMYGYFSLGGTFIGRALHDVDIIGASASYPTDAFLEQRGSISGSVTKSGSPAFGLQVSALNEAGVVVGSSISGASSYDVNAVPNGYASSSGDFRIAGLLPGTYSIVVEPLDGPADIQMRAPFGDGGTGLFVENDVTASAPAGPVSVIAGATVALGSVEVEPRSETSPNLDTVSYAALAGESFEAPAVITVGTSPFLALFFGENLVGESAFLAGTMFEISGDGVTIESQQVRSSDFLLQLAVAADATPGPRTLTATTPGGRSILNGAVIVVPEPTFLAQFANGAGIVSTVVLTNPSPAAFVTGQIAFVNDNGQALETGLLDRLERDETTFTIAPLGSFTVHTDGQGDLVAGSVKVSSTHPVGGVVKFSIPGIGVAGVGASAPVTDFVSPVRRVASTNLDTGVAILNLGSDATTLALTLRDANGLSVGSTSRTLQPSGHLSAFVGELFNLDAVDFSGTLTAAGGSTHLAGIVMELGTIPGQFTTMPVTQLNATPAGDLFFAHYADGLGVKSDMVLTNPMAGASVTGTVSLFDDNGSPLSTQPLGLGGATSFSVPALGSVTLPSDGQGNLVAGSASVNAGGALGGVVRFTLPGIGVAGVGQSVPTSSGFIVPALRNSVSGIDTGIAIAQTGQTTLTVRLRIRDEAGVLVENGETTVDLAARGHVARFIAELFPSAQTEAFRGTMTAEITAGSGQIVGTALEIGSSAGQFTTLPVTPLP